MSICIYLHSQICTYLWPIIIHLHKYQLDSAIDRLARSILKFKAISWPKRADSESRRGGRVPAPFVNDVAIKDAVL